MAKKPLMAKSLHTLESWVAKAKILVKSLSRQFLIGNLKSSKMKLDEIKARISFNKDKFKRFAHITAALIILLNALDKFDSGNPSYKIFSVAGIAFLLMAVFYDKLIKRFPWMDASFFLIEAVLSGIIAMEYFSLDKKGLPFVYLLLAGFQLFMGLFLSVFRRKDANEKVS